MTEYGRFTVQAAGELGDLGPAESLPVEVRWRWYYGVPALLLWAALVLAIVLTKANRKPQALLILVPLAIVNVAWLAFKEISGMPSADPEPFDMIFQSLTVALAILWLLAHKLAACGAFVRFGLAASIMIAVAVLGAIGFGLTTLDEDLTVLLFLVAVVFSILGALVLARRCCPQRFAAGRFMARLALWTVVASTAALYVLLLSWSAVTRMWPSDIAGVFLQIALVGVAVGVIVYVLILPYMVLALASGFFRERLTACLGIPPISQTDDAAPPTQPQEPEAQDREAVP